MKQQTPYVSKMIIEIHFSVCGIKYDKSDVLLIKQITFTDALPFIYKKINDPTLAVLKRVNIYLLQLSL